jgi:hypothetical protein
MNGPAQVEGSSRFKPCRDLPRLPCAPLDPASTVTVIPQFRHPSTLAANRSRISSAPRRKYGALCSLSLRECISTDTARVPAKRDSVRGRGHAPTGESTTGEALVGSKAIDFALLNPSELNRNTAVHKIMMTVGIARERADSLGMPKKMRKIAIRLCYPPRRCTRLEAF